MIPYGNGEVVLQAGPERGVGGLRQISQRIAGHPGRQRHAGAAVAQAVGIEPVLIAIPPPRRFQRVDACETVGGGREQAVGLVDLAAQQGVGGAGLGGFGGDVGLHLVHPAEKRLDLVKIQPVGSTLCRSLQVAQPRDAFVQCVDLDAVAAVFLGLQFQKAAKGCIGLQMR